MEKEHAGTKNMVPLGQPGNEEHDKMVRSKLKGSGSAKRKFAQKLSALKRGAVNPENVDAKILELVTSQEASAVQLYELLDIAKKRGIADSKLTDLVGVINAARAVHTAVHGTDTRIKTEDVNTNWDAMVTRMEEYKDVLIKEDKE